MKLLVFLLVLFHLGCDFNKDRRPNVIVLAVEGLGFDRVPCQRESLSDGFATLCEESVRFTHAYANSTNSLANLATVLTGLFPWEHGLRGQSQWLRPHRETVSERALRNGYKTALISSGLPLLAKTGLGQGFEHFDDRIDLFSRPHFRPARSVVSRFSRWLDSNKGAPFFTTLHFSDLLYPFEVSQTTEGELRDLSVGSQIEEMSEELGVLFRKLKTLNLWNQTYVVLVGLSGGKDPSSLTSSQTQVSLLIKPERVKRDQGTSWGVDLNVSLADLGVSLIEIVGGGVSEEQQDQERVSLSSVYNSPQPDWPDDRLIITEMYWAFENFGLDIVRAARRKHLLYIHQDPPLLFNTLTDRQELYPLPMKDQAYAVNFDLFSSLFERGLPLAEYREIPEWFYFGVEGFRKGRWDWLGEESSIPYPASSWVIRDLIEKRSWLKLMEASKNEPYIQYLALSWLNPQGDYSDLIRHLNCSNAFRVQSLKGLEKSLREHCDQDRLLQYVDWYQSRGGDQELLYENRYKRSYQFWWARLELGAMNYAAQGVLGLPLTWPLPPDVSEAFVLFREKRSSRVIMKNYTSKAKY